MNQPNARALARNTYSLDTVGVLAHLADTTRVYVTRISAVMRTRAKIPGGPDSLPRSRVGPANRVIEQHSITDAWRIR